MHSISTPSLHIDNPDPLHWLGYICRNSKTGRGIQTPILPPCKHKIDPALNMHVQGKSAIATWRLPKCKENAPKELWSHGDKFFRS